MSLPFVEDSSCTSSQVRNGVLPSDPSEGVIAGACSEPAKVEGSNQPPDLVLSEQQEGRAALSEDLSGLTYRERKKKISRDQRVSRYEEVMALHREGLGQRAIARTFRISRKIVQRFVCSSVFPERAEGTGLRPKGKNKLDPYLSYLRERWDAGIHKGSSLFHEIKARGYTGCPSLLGKVLSEWRTELPPTSRQGSPRKPRLFAQSRQRRLSSRGASFLMVLSPKKLTTKEQLQVESICQASSDLHTVYLLSQEFVTLLKERQAEALDSWLKRAKESQVSELGSFVNGIRRDYAAVSAACSLPWSNGITEGHVNRLKFLKRQMFGRAHLDLLRVKVLHAV